jgi:hypothetical protein
VCSNCIHFQDETEDLQGFARCWCPSAEFIISWRPERNVCKYWHDGKEVKNKMQQEMDFARMSVEAWLCKHGGRK